MFARDLCQHPLVQRILWEAVKYCLASCARKWGLGRGMPHKSAKSFRQKYCLQRGGARYFQIPPKKSIFGLKTRFLALFSLLQPFLVHWVPFQLILVEIYILIIPTMAYQ